MHAAAEFAQERHELEAILASGIFSRAPNLALVLTYVCEKYFEGAAEEIKEYNIAVEALGRPAEFDQKRDSIVRVEAHRLRKRLREYYETEGASRPIRIEIPSGRYAPRFIHKDAPQQVQLIPAENRDALTRLPPPVPKSRKAFPVWITILAVSAIAAILFLALPLAPRSADP